MNKATFSLPFAMLILTVVFFAGIFFFSCETADTKNTGKVTISLPVSEAARALNETQRNDYVSGLKYAVVCRGPGDSRIEREVSSGESISLELAVGRWNITVAVYNKNERAIGSQTVTEFIEGGKNKRVRIDVQLDEPIYMRAENGRLVSDKMDITVFYHHQLKENILYEFDIKYDSNIELSDLTAEIVFEESAFYLICELPEGGAQSAVVTNFNMTMEEKGEINDPEHQHVWGDWYETIEPTCYSKGVKQRRCLECHDFDSETREGADMTAHELSDWRIVTEATCLAGGEQKRNCIVHECHFEVYEPIPIDEAGHDWEYDPGAIESTCITEGSGRRHCKREGCDANEVSGSFEIAPHNHKNLSSDFRIPEGHEPTCEKDGESYLYCSDCHKYDKHNPDSYKKVDALGHDMGGWIVINETTCTTVGDEEKTCNRPDCNHSEKRFPPIDHNAHKWIGWTETTQPTCTAEGEETRVCEYNAAHTETRAGNPIIDHKPGDWELLTSATETTDGKEIAICTVCGETAGTRTLYATGTEGLSYTLIHSNTEYSVSAGTATGGEVYIPAFVKNAGGEYLPVTAIANEAFVNCSGLTSVTIPDSVTSIGSGAFRDCSGLTSVTIPDSVTSIGNGAFERCTGLTSVTIPDSVTSISDYAFSVCSGLTSVAIGNSVTSIGNQAFYYCIALTSVTIPDSLKSIGSYTFHYCNGLTSVTIPDSVTSIGSYAFSNCSGLTSVTIPDSVTSIGDSVFRNCIGLTSVTIPDSVTSIGTFAFGSCRGLTSITIPDSVTVIGDSAFSNCIALTSVAIGNSVTSIGSYTFSGCSGLTSITIPTGVTSLGDSAFYGCSGLMNIIVDSGNTEYRSEDNCLIRITDNVLIRGCITSIIPDGVTNISNGAFSGSSGLTSITIPDSVTSIGDSAFRDCSGLTSITIPDSVTIIGSYAFANCSGLTSITIPTGVTSIGNYAFRDCSGLTSITIPTGVTSIGNYTFYGCSGLTSITIPTGVTSIGNYAFENCSSLTSIIIPVGVTNIGSYAFLNCSGLTSVTVLAVSPPTLGTSALSGTPASIQIMVPSASVNAYKAAANWSAHAAKIFGF